MALIDCPDCGREVSNSAMACPECAYPIRPGTPSVPSRAIHPPSKTSWFSNALPIFGRLALGLIFFTIGMEEGEISAFFASAIIGGSAIPAWYKNKIDRLKAGQGGRLDERFDDQMAEFEHRNQERLDQMEQMTATQFADLEERIDFTERLLTKNREVGSGQ